MLLELLKGYQYHNSPDGTQPFEKVVATSKYGLAVGLLTGTYECTMNTAVDSTAKAANCMAFHVVPLTGICATFAAVTYASTKLRGKDGPLNYAIGAAVSAGWVYQITRLPVTALAYGIAGAMAAAAYKHSKDIGYELWPTTFCYFPEYNTIGPDYTLKKDPRPWKG